MMVKIEQFNEILGVWKSPPGSPVVVAIGEGRESVYSLRDKPGKGVDMFRVMIDDGDYEHVALVDNGRVMAIWHRDSKAAAPAQPAGDFGVGDRVVIRKDAIVEHVAFIADELAELRDNQVQGEVISIREYPNGDPIKVQFPKDYYFFTPDELTLWTPAEPGSDAKDEYTRDEEQARLITRIRELEEALEDTRNLTTDAPKNGIGYDQLRMEILTRIANILDGEDAAIDVQMKWNN